MFIWQVILKGMLSLGGKKSPMPLKMRQLGSFFTITSFIHEEEALAIQIHPSMFHRPACFQCALGIVFFWFFFEIKAYYVICT